jgi:penicillin-binding protein 2
MTPLSGGPAEGFIERRVTGAALVVLAVWILLLARLFYLQVVQVERYAQVAERNSVRTYRVEAPRGMILDRHGEILVDARPALGITLVPSETEDLELTLRRVARLARVEEGGLVERYGSPSGAARFKTQRVLDDLDRAAFARIGERLWALPGVHSEYRTLRDYRGGEVGAHLLGWLGEIDADQLGDREYQGYRSGDVVGRKGVEKLLERELRGRPGGENWLVDAHGRELEQLSAVEPQPGLNAALTLDRHLQQVAEQALDELGKAGSIVALDPRNGEILVLASRPGFDPNRFASGIDAAQWKALMTDERAPLHFRALQGQYPPGSTYKIVTAIAGLEEGVIRPGLEVHCGGSFRLGRRSYRCWRRGGHGVVDVHKALVQSCDVFFYRVGLEVGVDRLAYYARSLGLGAPTGIELPDEKAGLVPTRAWKERRFGEPWMEGETVSVSIGQGFNLWTPLQLASAYAALASGGTRWRPHLVKRVLQPDGTLVREVAPESAGPLPFKEATIRQVRDALRGVVQEPRGTGGAMRNLPGGVEAAGKTGTAQVIGMKGEPPEDESLIPERYRDHAWFVTYLPAEDPRLVIAVLVEHGGHGGSAAAPVAARVARAFLEGEAARQTKEQLVAGY